MEKIIESERWVVYFFWEQAHGEKKRRKERDADEDEQVKAGTKKKKRKHEQKRKREKPCTRQMNTASLLPFPVLSLLPGLLI